MLRWICGHTRRLVHKRRHVRNDDIRDRLGVAPIKEKLVQHRLGWFEHVQRRPLETPVRGGGGGFIKIIVFWSFSTFDLFF